jgi:hypothetical protein
MNAVYKLIREMPQFSDKGNDHRRRVKEREGARTETRLMMKVKRVTTAL